MLFSGYKVCYYLSELKGKITYDLNKRKVKGNIGHDMEGNWYLYSDSIINKFENYKEKLLEDIMEQEESMTQLQKIVDEKN